MTKGVAPERATIELAYPITIDGTDTKALHMRRPKVRDQLLMDKSGMSGKSDSEREVLFFANLCEISPAEIEQLDMGDYLKLQETFSGFLRPPAS